MGNEESLKTTLKDLGKVSILCERKQDMQREKKWKNCSM